MVKWKAKKDNWRNWFAWHPVKIEGTWVWLEWVERQLVNRVWGSQIITEAYYRESSGVLPKGGSKW